MWVIGDKNLKANAENFCQERKSLCRKSRIRRFVLTSTIIGLFPGKIYKLVSETVLPKQNKMSAFHAQDPTQTCVWHGQKRSPHHSKNKKRKVLRFPRFFAFLVCSGVIWT